MKQSTGSQRARRLVVAGVLIAAAALGSSAWVWRTGAQRESETDQRADREHPIVTAPRVAREDGRTVVRLDPTALQRAGVRTEKLHRGAQPETIRAFATVTDLQPLAQLSASMQAAAAQLAIAQAKIAASRAEYERARRLFDDQQNVSAAQLQSSQAAFAADQAALAAAQAQLDASRASARLDWGAQLADALSASDPQQRALVEGLFARRELLLQVVLPAESGDPHAPAQGQVLLDGRIGQPIRLVSPATRADPRLAGRSFFYRARPDPALVPGATVAVQLETGRRVEAVHVPASALVWWQGRAWIFVRNETGDFERREVPADRAADSSTLLADLATGTEVVVQGAQVLLSEELRAGSFSTDVGGR
jgi:hypothetical protein